jgi:AcrR family transcriptional regulator
MDDDQSPPRQRGLGGTARAPKLDDNQIRDAMLTAGAQLVDQTGGLTVSLGHLSYETIIANAGVSRSAAYRLWPYKDEFYVELVEKLAGPDWQHSSNINDASIELAERLLTEARSDLATPAGRQGVLRQGIRQVVELNFNDIVVSTRWRTYVAITATLLSTPDGHDKARVLTALRAAEQDFVNTMAQFYEAIFTALGYRLRPPFDSWELLTSIAASLLEGIALRQQALPEFTDRRFSIDGPDGTEDWSLPALAYMTLIEQMVEPDPDFDPQRSATTGNEHSPGVESPRQ